MMINDSTSLEIKMLITNQDVSGLVNRCAHPPRHHNKQELMHFCIDTLLAAQHKINKSLVLSGLIHKGLQLENAEHGKTVLTRVVAKSDLELTELLLSSGANPNNTDQDDKSPLYYAAVETKNTKIVQALIDAGANPLLPIKSSFGDNVFELLNFNEKTAADFDKIADRDWPHKAKILKIMEKAIADNPDFQKIAKGQEIKEEHLQKQNTAAHLQKNAKPRIPMKRRR